MKFKTGEAYFIRFYDHAMSTDEAIECEIFGRVVKQCDNFLVFSWWNILNSDTETIENNRELVSIVKSTILQKRKLS